MENNNNNNVLAMVVIAIFGLIFTTFLFLQTQHHDCDHHYQPVPQRPVPQRPLGPPKRPYESAPSCSPPPGCSADVRRRYMEGFEDGVHCRPPCHRECIHYMKGYHDGKNSGIKFQIEIK